MILIIIFVFDPLAVLLLIAANIGWENERENRVKKIGRSENRIAKDGKLVDAMKMETDKIEEATLEPKKEKVTYHAGTAWFARPKGEPKL